MKSGNKNGINFQVVTTDYDNASIKKELKVMIETQGDAFAEKLNKASSDFISSYRDKIVYDNADLEADIIVIDDQLSCILQYFKTITKFSETDNFPIKSVIGCTKSNAAHIVLDKVNSNLLRKHSVNSKLFAPKLVIMDFELKEQDVLNNVSTDSFILKGLVNKVLGNWDIFNTDVVAVSAYAFKDDKRFNEFQQLLRDGLVYTFPKQPDLWDEERMFVYYRNYLLRERSKPSKELVNLKVEQEKLLIGIETKHEKWKVDSTVELLDSVEAAIKHLEHEGKTVNHDLLNPKVRKKDGSFYTANSFKGEVGKKKDVIADIIGNANQIPSFKNRWDKLCQYVSTGVLFPKAVKRQISSK